MKKNQTWIIPGIFFLAAVSANLLGCVTGNLALEHGAKGALLPLLSLTGITYLAARSFDMRTAAILILAQLFGWAGDSLLMGEPFAMFASGLGAFLLGHVCYISIFSRSLKGLGTGGWIITVIVKVCILVALVLAIGIHGALLPPMFIYGAALLTIIWCGLRGILKKDRKGLAPKSVWVLIMLGGLLFLFSDGLIAMRTFGMGDFPQRGFVIMATYILAQVLLGTAGCRLAIYAKK